MKRRGLSIYGSLHIHRAERADGLVEALGDVVVDPLDDPMVAEVVAVPTRGVERWLTQRLSARLGATPGRGDGVCANVDFPFPGRLVGGAVAAATGVDRDADPWLPERSVWPLLDVVDGAWASRGWRRWPATSGGRRHDASATRHRGRPAGSAPSATSPTSTTATACTGPAMLRAWAAGDDIDGAGGPLPRRGVAGRAVAAAAGPHRHRRARPSGSTTPARRSAGRPGLVDLPARLSLFGLTRLPASYLAGAARAGRRTGTCTSSSSTRRRRCGPGAPRPPDGRRAPVVRRRDRPHRRPARQPAAGLLGPGRPGDAAGPRPPATAPRRRPTDHHAADEAAERPSCTGIQADVRADRHPPGAPLPGEADRPARSSTPATAASGPRLPRPGPPGRGGARRHPPPPGRRPDPRGPRRHRHVPRHRGLRPAHPRHLRRRRASRLRRRRPARLGRRRPGRGRRRPDRPTSGSAWPTGPCARPTRVLGVVAELLDLAVGPAHRRPGPRLGRPGARPAPLPLRRRRPRPPEDWVAATGVRWGLDAAHRAPFQLDAVDANTWRAGLDRVLLGVAMAEDGQPPGRRRPAPRRRRQRRHRPGRPLAELIDRLAAALDGLSGPQPVGAWAEPSPTPPTPSPTTAPSDAWQGAQLAASLDDVVAEAQPPAASAAPTPSRSPARRSERACWPTGSRAARPGPTSAPAT